MSLPHTTEYFQGNSGEDELTLIKLPKRFCLLAKKYLRFYSLLHFEASGWLYTVHPFLKMGLFLMYCH